MTKQEFSGKSLDEALDNAAQTLGVEKSSLSYNILPSAQSGGLLSKLFSRSVRIEAWSDDALNNAAREAVRQVIEKKDKPEPRQTQSENRREQPRREKQKPTPNQNRPERQERSAQENRRNDRPRRPERRPENQQRQPRPERTDEPMRPSIPLTNPDVQALFDEYKGVFLKTFEIPAENCSKTDDDGGNWTVSIQDSHIEDQLAHSDKLAVAFEHLFKRLAQKKVGDVGGRIYLTAGQAEEKRQEALRNFAFSLAEKVKRTGRSITVASKTSQERRVIHLTLDGQPGIATRSVGSGEKRRLIVYPTGPRQNRGADANHEGAQASNSQEDGEGQPRRNRRRGRRGRGNGRGRNGEQQSPTQE